MLLSKRIINHRQSHQMSYNFHTAIPSPPQLEQNNNHLKNNTQNIHSNLIPKQTANRPPIEEIHSSFNTKQTQDIHKLFNRTSIFANSNSYFPITRPKGKENLYGKITEILRQEECNLSICPSSKKKLSVVVNDRPNSSLSSRKYSLEKASPQGQMVLQLIKNQNLPDDERISTSRALMNFSKVYKRTPKDRFRVKRQKSMFPRFVEVSAQKVVFQEKEKVQKKEVRKSSMSYRKKSQCRYSVPIEEQFELAGWDYFQQ